MGPRKIYTKKMYRNVFHNSVFMAFMTCMTQINVRQLPLILACTKMVLYDDSNFPMAVSHAYALDFKLSTKMFIVYVI